MEIIIVNRAAETPLKREREREGARERLSFHTSRKQSLYNITTTFLSTENGNFPRH